MIRPAASVLILAPSPSPGELRGLRGLRGKEGWRMNMSGKAAEIPKTRCPLSIFVRPVRQAGSQYSTVKTTTARQDGSSVRKNKYYLNIQILGAK